MIVRREGVYVGIQCDKCNVAAPPEDVIRAGHGLVNLGWYCSGGTHICPVHEHPEPTGFMKGALKAKPVEAAPPRDKRRDTSTLP